jgi:poly-gamma-glutamate capsule biosynthesis protein CapA/YwtB (metallophosphatase superfamily)
MFSSHSPSSKLFFRRNMSTGASARASACAFAFAGWSVLLTMACEGPRRPGKPEASAEGAKSPLASVRGRVVDLAGDPVGGARVDVEGASVLTNSQGEFVTPLGAGPRWVSVSHPSFVPRARVGSPAEPLVVRLTDDPEGDVVTLAFGGDTMVSRRFYDPNEDGKSDDALVAPGAEARDMPLLLRNVAPFLKLPDLVTLNFESPILDDDRIYKVENSDPPPPSPNVNATSAARDPVYHPTKAYAFASKPEALRALKAAGVDMLGLANNHVYDAMEVGVSTTLDALAKEGFAPGTGSFGLGRNVDEAWKPAFVDVVSARQKASAQRSVERIAESTSARKGMRVAFLGCTTISGKEHAIDYVASNTKGGAPQCDEVRIAASVAAARGDADAVIFQIHGGKEYSREATPPVARFADAALKAGADFLINHHPHVVGGFSLPAAQAPLPGKPAQPTRLVAWSLGNFLFDQTVWPTFESYMLFLQFRRGSLVRAYVEPFAVERYAPKPVTGGLAASVASGAAGRSYGEGGPFVVENGAVELLPKAAVEIRKRSVAANAFKNTKTALVSHIGETLSFGHAATRVGRDVLWVGRFEDEILGVSPRGGPFWLFEGPDKEISPRFAFHGLYGAALWREAPDEKDVLLTPKHRFLAKPMTDVTLAGRARSTTGKMTVEVAWYKDSKGASYKREVLGSVGGQGAWNEFRFDFRIPNDMDTPGSVEAKPSYAIFFRLPPEGRPTEAAFDDLSVVEWAPQGTLPTLEHTHSLHPVHGNPVTLVRTCLRGACP